MNIIKYSQGKIIFDLSNIDFEDIESNTIDISSEEYKELFNIKDLFLKKDIELIIKYGSFYLKFKIDSLNNDIIISYNIQFLTIEGGSIEGYTTFELDINLTDKTMSVIEYEL